jgi:DNA repair photolyase
VTRGREWGDFLEVRVDAAASYARHVTRERRWARRQRGRFEVFMSSSTDPFVPQERRYRVTRSVLEAMLEDPPDTLILQTHTHRVCDEQDRLAALAERGAVRVHLSIEGDRDRLPGLPPPASPVARRLEAAEALRAAGVPVVVTVAPLLPIADPDDFFRRVAAVADAVVLDHFVGGDGSPDGRRTRATALPTAMAALDPESVELAYLERMVAVAGRHLPGRVGVGAPGFAGVYDRG